MAHRRPAASVLRGMLDAASDGLLALDAHGTILDVNEAAAGILGHVRPLLVGKPLARVVELTDRRAFRQAFAAAVAGERPELEVRTPADPKPWRLTLRAVVHADPVAVAATLNRDGGPPLPAPRTSAGERLDRLVVRFPQAVVAIRPDGAVAYANGRARALLGRESVRTGAPLGDSVPGDVRAAARRLVAVPVPMTPLVVDARGRRLRISGIAADGEEPAVLLIEDVTEQEAHDSLMREFVRNAAHQLRTPLAGITAAVETLQSGAKDTPEVRDRFLGHIQTHAERLSRIARGLLTLARAQVGDPPPVTVVEMRPLLERAAKETRPRDGVELRVECPPSLAAVAVPDLLEESVAVLLDNAVEHTVEGHITVTATQRDGQLAFTVADTGPGIRPEFQGRVFDPFFRVGAGGAGYGLGLAIAAQAVETMRGTIGVSSTEGEGTVFTVTLPSATLVE